jgi:uncharacterized protein (TIGR03492 family)
VRICFLSNGPGEDYGAAVIASALAARRPRVETCGAPLVTEGEAYARRGIPLATRGWMPPSGGFPATSLTTALRDASALPRYGGYVRRLRRSKSRDDIGVPVGDTFLLGLARMAFGARTLHVAVAKSVHARPHSAVERLLLRRWKSIVLARDEATAEHLVRSGVRASCEGNPLVDGFDAPVAGTNRPPRVLLLPGSRAEAARNLQLLLRAVERVGAEAVWQCAWPPSRDVSEAVRAAMDAGWQAGSSALGRGGRRVELAPAMFASLLPHADLVVGLAGTAHEQAAALGKPVVTFEGSGPQSTASRMAEQERLLGGAGQFVRGQPADVAVVIERLLADPAERARRGRLGRERMGPAGAGDRIAARLVTEFSL